jgi:UDP-N-acetyl-D-glucosamine dehydrogenase
LESKEGAVTETTEKLGKDLIERITSRKATIGIVGMGYVGLPLAIAAHQAGFSIIGFDIDADKVKTINRGQSPIHTIATSKVAAMIESRRFHATSDFAEAKAANAIMICVPTPLSHHREPDVSFIENTGESLFSYLQRGQMVILESSTFPGTTLDVLTPILEKSGLKAGKDFFVAFSPEREDPGNPDFTTATTARVVGGDDPLTAEIATTLYKQIINKVVTVSSCATAEAVKLTENIFRAVNIALVNELKVIFTPMGINVWEVIDAAKTKPFGFMPFYPGPGIGGHCIPIDPFYLTWKAREFNVPTRFIELAGEINAAAPRYVIDRLVEGLSRNLHKSLCGSKVLLLGLAYKKNVDDMRESPSLRILELLEERGAKVDFYDTFIPVVPKTREHAHLAGRRSVTWDKETISSYDVALICTDHDTVDYTQLVEWSPLVVDTRNATRDITTKRDKIVLA